jgi:hypothetical protein
MFSENFFQIQQFYKSSNFKVKVNKFVLSNLIEVSTEQKKTYFWLVEAWQFKIVARNQKIIPERKKRKKFF